MGLTSEICNIIQATHYESLGEECVMRVKQAIQDGVAVALAGCTEPPIRIAVEPPKYVGIELNEAAEALYAKQVEELAELGYIVMYFGATMSVRHASGDEHSINHGFTADKYKVVKQALDRAKSIS